MNNNGANNIAIIADGCFPVSEYPLSLLRNADTIICCDNSVVKLIQHTGLTPDFIVGDMDTMSEENKQHFKDIIRRFPDQETNDLTKAFKFALTLNPGMIHILGATGSREDHTLGNISLLAEYAVQFTNIDIVTDFGIFTAHYGSCSIQCTPGQQVSIFAFDSTLKIKSEGLKYPTDNVIFDLWWKATLNETCSTEFTLNMNHPAMILVFRCSHP